VLFLHGAMRDRRHRGPGRSDAISDAGADAMPVAIATAKTAAKAAPFARAWVAGALCVAMLAGGAAMLGGCALLPVEEAPLPAPVMKPYEAVTLTMASVKRGALVKTQRITANYRPFKEETYYFAISGIYVAGVYVSTGDVVKTGDLLAELDRKEILNQIEEAQFELSLKEVDLEYAGGGTAVEREKADLAQLNAKLALLPAVPTTAEETEARRDLEGRVAAQTKKIAQTEADLAFSKELAQKEIDIAKSKLALLQELADERAIYATMDGMVSYARNFKADSRSVESERVITVSDASQTVFFVSGRDVALFEVGKTYDLKVGDAVYPARCAAPEELGEKSSADSPLVYFFPENYNSDIANYGTIEIETARSDDTLYLPADAVRETPDGYIVYKLNEAGLREMLPVEIGLLISGKQEILSGLAEGEEVIIDD